MKFYKHLALPLVGTIALAIPSQAAITLLDSVGFTNNIGSTEDSDGNNATRTVGASELGSFDANGADKLVITIGGEGEGNGADDNTVTGVTYGGVTMNPVVSVYGNGNRGTSMWYLDNVSVTGEFVITFAVNQSGLGFGAYALDGTLDGTAANTATTTATTGTQANQDDMDLAVTDGDFVIASFARNNVPSPFEVQAPLTELYLGATDGSSAAGGYQFATSTGTLNPQIVNLTNGVGGLLAANFEPDPIPEPNAAVLGLFGAGFLMLRGRRK